MANRSFSSAIQSSLTQREVSPPLLHPIGRIEAATAARILGFQEHDIPILVSHGLLKPLGKPTQNARKYFASVHVLALADDPRWLDKATQVVYDYWKGKNAQKTDVLALQPKLTSHALPEQESQASLPE
jgi:hypothetical protein